jgi:hypothetical protein
MTLSDAIRLAYAPNATTEHGKLEQAYARAVVATWSASCATDRYVNLAPYHAEERAARKALDAYMTDTDDLYKPSHS